MNDKLKKIINQELDIFSLDELSLDELIAIKIELEKILKLNENLEEDEAKQNLEFRPAYIN